MNIIVHVQILLLSSHHVINVYSGNQRSSWFYLHMYPYLTSSWYHWAFLVEISQKGPGQQGPTGNCRPPFSLSRTLGRDGSNKPALGRNLQSFLRGWHFFSLVFCLRCFWPVARLTSAPVFCGPTPNLPHPTPTSHAGRKALARFHRPHSLQVRPSPFGRLPQWTQTIHAVWQMQVDAIVKPLHNEDF